MKVLRTLDDRFGNLPDFPYAPHYLTIHDEDGTVLRVAYSWEDEKLVRFYWPVMDRTTSTAPVRMELLDKVRNVEVRFLDGGGEWHLEWPPVDRREIGRAHV